MNKADVGMFLFLCLMALFLTSMLTVRIASFFMPQPKGHNYSYSVSAGVTTNATFYRARTEVIVE